MFDIKNHILHVSRTSTALKGKSPDPLKDIDKLKLQTNFDVNMTSFLGGVPNFVLKL